MMNRIVSSQRSTSLIRGRFLSSVPHEQHEISEDVDTFRRIVMERHACKFFLPTPVDDDILKDVLKMTHRAPSSFNSQPWACVIVKDQKRKERLANSMLGPNVAKVLSAPMTAVFLADLRPTKRLPRLMEEAQKNGVPDDAVAKLPSMVALFGGEGCVTGAVKRGVTSALSPLKPMPSLSSTEAWSYKQTCLASQIYMLAATAHGLGTAPMEGFDSRRVLAALDIPDRYGVPIVVATGYEDRKAAEGRKQSWRLPEKEVFFLDRFGDPAL